jgi:hypothetical protein
VVNSDRFEAREYHRGRDRGIRGIDRELPESDGLKWLNWLYLTVTKAVDLSVGAGASRWRCRDWLIRLDIVFAGLFPGALVECIGKAAAPPKSSQVLLESRHDTQLAWIQFALAGMNAHIEHDLPIAVGAACRESDIAPVHLSPQYRDYCQVNDLLDGIINQAKKELLVGLLGNALPSGSLLRTCQRPADHSSKVLPA